MNVTILKQQLQLFVKYGKFLRRAIEDIWSCKGDFRNIYFLQRTALSECL